MRRRRANFPGKGRAARGGGGLSSARAGGDRLWDVLTDQDACDIVSGSLRARGAAKRPGFGTIGALGRSTSFTGGAAARRTDNGVGAAAAASAGATDVAAKEAAEMLLRVATQRQSQDNITVLVSGALACMFRPSSNCMWLLFYC